ncbi:MAG: hypothetical protein Q7T18_05690, partial [Sedimentisphaerales bacterium]|nr:hypothetical protein [Sedimentisphaerales bacterium]
EQHKSCLEMQKDFNARVETLRVEFEKLAGEIDAAVNKHAIKNLDPMVVDARNVPTGLPKFVEDNIPNTPAGNRIRRGFQAVMDHNWEVALVWFRDAHNHEPTDASIMRLIDLAEYTLYKGIVPRPPASNRTLTPEDKAQIEATMAALDHIGDTWMEDELVEALLDYCCRNGLREQPAGGQLQLPLDSDIEFLLDRNTVPAKPSVPTEKKQPHN